MKRSASLDFLRGAAAFAVAVPHYLTANAAVQPDGGGGGGRVGRGVLRPQRFRARAADRRLGGRAAVAEPRRVPRPAVDAHDSALRRRARRRGADDRQPLHRGYAALSFLCREPHPLLERRRFLSGRLEPRGRGVVLPPVRAAIVPCGPRAWPQRPAHRRRLRDPVRARRRSAEGLRRAGRLGPERSPGDALSHRFDRVGLPALSGAGAAAVARAEEGAGRAMARRPWRGVRRSGCARIPGRDAGARRRARRPSGLSLRIRPVRGRRRRRIPGGRRSVQGAADRGAELLSRPHLILGLSLPHRHRDGAEAADRRVAARPATRALCRGDLSLLDDLLARFRAADPGRAAGLSAKAAGAGGRRGGAAGGPARAASDSGSRPGLCRRRGAGARRLHDKCALDVLSGADRDGGPCGRARRAGRPVRRFARGGRAGVRPLRARAACGGRRLSVLDRRADRRLARQPDLFLSRRAREPGRLRDVVVLLSQRMDPGRRHSGRDREARPAERASVRHGSRRDRPDVRHDDPHQFRRFPRAGNRRGEGRPLPHRRARRVRRRSGRPCTRARSRGRSCCRTCSQPARPAAGRSR